MKLLVVALLAAGWRAEASGTWTPLVNQAPGNANAMLLLTDGTVIINNSSTSWWRLTPDVHGSYVNGTWSNFSSMNHGRLYYASQVLANGDVFIAGGEYGDTGSSTSAEVWNSQSNTWSLVPNTNYPFRDAISKLLPDGEVLVNPFAVDTVLYDPVSNTTAVGPPTVVPYQEESDWVHLPDESILTVDFGATTSERYIPSLNQWIQDTSAPVYLWDTAGEIGSFHLLPNGKVFCIGAAPVTAIYTPSGSTAPGTWVQGPNIPNNLGATDAPAASMVNGKILMTVGPTGTYNAPTTFYEYDYVANTLTQINGPTGTTLNTPTYVCEMLALPDGSILFSDEGTQCYVYQPAGTPLAAGKPSIQTLATNPDGSYHLTGTEFNGISEGAKYNDDAQMDTNWPIVRATNNASGNVYYAKTFGWNPGVVATGTAVVETNFSFPAGLPSGTYSLVVVANGNSSNAVTFTPSGAPFGGTPAAIPGTVQAENYDTGGQGLAYNVTSINGSDNGYRPDGVDLELTSDTGGGLDLGWTTGGQWFKYTVNVATAGTYTVSFRVAGPSAVTDAFHISNASGTNLSGAVNLPGTGGWQTWATVTANVTLPAGQQILTINQDNGGWNLNYATFAQQSSGEGPYGGTPAAIPGTVQAENYDTGGQGLAYNVTSINGTDNGYRPDGVDLEATSDTGGGVDLGWTTGGQWFKYTVNVATAGTYTVSFRVAGPSAVTDAFHISNASGTNLSGAVNLPGTGGWQTWVTVIANVTLPAGQQILTLNQDNGGWNINYATFTTSGGTTFTINASAGTGGSINPSGAVTVNQGATQAFIIAPSSGYTISSVTVDGANQGAIGSYTFSNVQGNHTINAAFQANTVTYTITASAGTGGSVSPSGSVSVNQGATQAFTISANSGYSISSVTVDGSNVGAVTSYTFSNVQANHTISAAFASSGGTCVTATSGGSWQNSSMSPQSGTFTATFDATPSASPDNAVVALSNGAQTAFSGFACLVRFNTTGHIDAYNGTAYAAASTISYSAGTSYHFSLAVNVTAKTYSITVTPAGGSAQTVGTNYAFRASATSLNNWGTYVDANGGSGTLQVCNFSP